MIMTTTIETKTLNLRVGDIYVVNGYVWFIVQLEQVTIHYKRHLQITFYDLDLMDTFTYSPYCDKYPPEEFQVYRNGKRLEW